MTGLWNTWPEGPSGLNLQYNWYEMFMHNYSLLWTEGEIQAETWSRRRIDGGGGGSLSKARSGVTRALIRSWIGRTKINIYNRVIFNISTCINIVLVEFQISYWMPYLIFHSKNIFGGTDNTITYQILHFVLVWQVKYLSK